MKFWKNVSNHGFSKSTLGGGVRGVLWISSDKDDWRTFLGLKFFIQVFFWVAWPGHIVLVMFFLNVLFSILYHFTFNAFWNFLRLRNSAWDFFGFCRPIFHMASQFLYQNFATIWSSPLLPIWSIPLGKSLTPDEEVCLLLLTT